jgi:hypothetical protein
MKAYLAGDFRVSFTDPSIESLIQTTKSLMLKVQEHPKDVNAWLEYI